MYLSSFLQKIMPGPPFAFGAVLVFLALLVAIMIPSNPHSSLKAPSKRLVQANVEKFPRETGKKLYFI
jgi:hypothetical protein